MDINAFNQKLRSQAHPVVIDFWAPWCGPCRMIEPSLHKLEQEYSGRVDVWKINADENADLAQAMRIYGIPTLLVFRGEQEVMRTTGAQPPTSLGKLFEAALTGKVAEKTGISPVERFVRTALGLGLIFVTWFMHLPVFWYIPGAIVVFSAFYDRCPLWQALSPRVSNLIGNVFHLSKN